MTPKAPKLPSTFQTAKELLAMEPMPPNAQQILEGLKAQTPEEFKADFSELFEALIETLDGGSWP